MADKTIQYISNEYPNMMDLDQMSVVNSDKTVTLGNIGKIYRGENNSQMLLFRIDRYYDNVDLKDKSIMFIYRDALGAIRREYAINIQNTDEYIWFNWLITIGTTHTVGKISACIEFSGADEIGNNYVLKSSLFNFYVEEALDTSEITSQVPTDWFLDIENRLNALENLNGGTNGISMFSGTRTELNQALNAGLIKEGMLVNVFEEDLDLLDNTQTSTTSIDDEETEITIEPTATE